MCGECFSNNRLRTTTTYTVNCEDSVIVIKNVPCLECRRCGEQFFTEEVSRTVSGLVKAAKALRQDVAVIDYSKAVPAA